MIIYLDNAATSWPKPDSVPEAIVHHLRDIGASPGRSGHRLANEAERIRYDARAVIAELLGIRDPLRVVFTLNATAALNLVIRGLLTPGSHAVTTSMEHNSVVRPLRALEQSGVEISVAPCRADGTIDPDVIEEHVKLTTRLIVVNHASNVCGTVLPIREIGEIARRHRVPFLVDAAQTAGCWPIDMSADQIDLLAFAGHKSLLGPSGTGGLVIGDNFDASRLPPMTYGGTGSGTERDTQPDFLPDKYESGTPNISGLAGLAAGVRYVQERGIGRIREHERNLTKSLIEGLDRITGVGVLGTKDASRQTATISFTIDGLSASDAAQVLDERFGIMCRPGMHCAPSAHRTLGTSPVGTIRIAPGPFSTPADVDRLLAAVSSLATGE
ncbi:MAG: aminotransferase class V-fold PLP-dependent enzyme [Planctomycetes bacterium]|nr:aminotransferase class V-fold PLP-dependent enzyme [Planctomycetota bacterium]